MKVQIGRSKPTKGQIDASKPVRCFSVTVTFQTIMLSDVPILDSMRDDAARRFINLIDEFYDRHVKLIISAEALPDDLYKGSRLEFEFVRAASRLQEMQTVEYLKVQREVVGE